MYAFAVCLSNRRFQSTPSAGRATMGNVPPAADIDISIHALRGEGDQTLFRRESSSNHFNIRHYENL